MTRKFMPLAVFVAILMFANLTAAQSLRTIYQFHGSFVTPPDGWRPMSGMILDGGNLYGTTAVGGPLPCNNSNGCGTVFKIDPATSTETILYYFTGINNGYQPEAGVLLRGSTLYGTTLYGGVSDAGTVYKLSLSGQETLLYSFRCANYGYPCPRGSSPESVPLVENGYVIGTTASGGAYNLGTVFRVSQGGTETVLHSFSGTQGDGSTPFPGLIRDANGNLYGTTYTGGSPTLCYNPQGFGCGTVFKVDTKGVLSIVYTFTGPTQGDGAFPYGALTLDSAGNLYGTTLYGGTGGCPYAPFGCGTVFKVDPAGNETVLHSFTSANGDGDSPVGVVLGPNGRLYGTANGGGSSLCNGYGCGMIYSLDPSSGEEAILFTFDGGADGGFPTGPMILDRSGKRLFGVTISGGDLSHCSTGCGTVFELTP
jgi:uncharacterized repeat protein (TIGR03803 family)